MFTVYSIDRDSDAGHGFGWDVQSVSKIDPMDVRPSKLMAQLEDSEGKRKR